jgi:hypothetical protein
MTKKLNIYPMACQLTKKDGSHVSVQIIKLSAGGALINSLSHPMKAGDSYKAVFVLPIKHNTVEIEAVVYKTYDHFKGQHGLVSPGNHISELTFKSLTPDARKAIQGFLTDLQLSRV